MEDIQAEEYMISTVLEEDEADITGGGVDWRQRC